MSHLLDVIGYFSYDPLGVFNSGKMSGAGLIDQKSPSSPASPAAPDPNAAADTAAAQLTASRRALIASGGETNLTGIGGAPLLGANIMTPGVGAT